MRENRAFMGRGGRSLALYTLTLLIGGSLLVLWHRRPAGQDAVGLTPSPARSTRTILSSPDGESFRGEVVGVIDGDTLDVLREGKAERVRLIGIDCPERRQAFGTKARERASELVVRKTVTVEIKGRDRDGRTLGEVILADGRSLNQELVREGLAWWFKRYSKDQKLAALEVDAREAKRGLWSESAPVAPWDFRKQKREKPRSLMQ